MNILFIAPWRQFCGWGSGSKDFARALNTIGNVTLRNIFLSNQRDNNVPQDLLDLENTKYDKYDILIQRVLPNHYAYDGRFEQNIALGVFETEMTYHHWLYRMSLMDKVLVGSKKEANWISKKTKTPVFNISEPLDVSIVDKEYPKQGDFFDGDIFRFLFIGEAIQRKGINDLITAYFNEFTINDNVLLILKTNANIVNSINEIKKGLRRFINDTRYPSIYLIIDKISPEAINGLHQHCDCFVMPSYGEAFNRPAATSLLFGKPVIATKNIGINDYLDNNCGWLIESTKDRVFCSTPPVPEIYRGNEFYQIPSINSLMKCMREAYESNEQYKNKCLNIQQRNYKKLFSYENIGQNILKAINV